MSKELEAVDKILLALEKSKGLFEDIFVSEPAPIKPTLRELSNAIKLIPLVESALKRLPELKKAFVSLSKEDEKAKKLLSKEIEKNRAFEIIKKKRVNVGKFIDMLEDWKSITYKDWLNYKEENGYYLQDELNELEFGIITQEEYDLLKEVLL